MENILTAIRICGYSLKPPLSSLRPQIMFSSLTCKINSPPTAPESYPITASARIHPLDRYRSRRLCFLGITPYIRYSITKLSIWTPVSLGWLGSEPQGSAFISQIQKPATTPSILMHVLGIKLKSCCLQGKHFPHRAIFPAPFCTVLFLETGSCYVALASLELMAIHEVSTSQVLVYSMHYQVRLFFLCVCFLLSVPGNKILSKKKIC